MQLGHFGIACLTVPRERFVLPVLVDGILLTPQLSSADAEFLAHQRIGPPRLGGASKCLTWAVESSLSQCLAACTTFVGSQHDRQPDAVIALFRAESRQISMPESGSAKSSASVGIDGRLTAAVFISYRRLRDSQLATDRPGSSARCGAWAASKYCHSDARGALSITR